MTVDRTVAERSSRKNDSRKNGSRKNGSRKNDSRQNGSRTNGSRQNGSRKNAVGRVEVEKKWQYRKNAEGRIALERNLLAHTGSGLSALFGCDLCPSFLLKVSILISPVAVPVVESQLVWLMDLSHHTLCQSNKVNESSSRVAGALFLNCHQFPHAFGFRPKGVLRQRSTVNGEQRQPVQPAGRQHGPCVGPFSCRVWGHLAAVHRLFHHQGRHSTCWPLWLAGEELEAYAGKSTVQQGRTTNRKI